LATLPALNAGFWYIYTSTNITKWLKASPCLAFSQFNVENLARMAHAGQAFCASGLRAACYH
jgi:hypothetical protein